MTQKSYLFYDIETTGRNKCFDQVLQFAAIRTTLDLKELERIEIQIKLNIDVIPDPEAMLVHGISIDTMQQGESELAAMKKIHALLNEPGTLSGGYNTLGFDDEFLRFSFYRNLLPPYNHQFAQNCGRFDLFPITQLYYLYKPELLHWPVIEGKPSLKLEHLIHANHLTTGNAHNALVDVEATLALARIFFQEKAHWDYAHGYFDKQTDLKRIEQLKPAFSHNNNKHPLGLLIGNASSQDFYHFPALFLGQHRHYKNQMLWLRIDHPDLHDTTAENIPEKTWVVRKKTGENKLLLPFAPKYTHYLTTERQRLMQANLAWLQDNPRMFAEIKEYHLEYTYPKIPNLDADAALYDCGFPTPRELQLHAQFHQAVPEKKYAVAHQFTQPVGQEIALRLLGRHYSSYLPQEAAQKFQTYVQQLYLGQGLLDYRGQSRLSAEQALARITELCTTRPLNEAQQGNLKQYAGFLQHTFMTSPYSILPKRSILPPLEEDLLDKSKKSPEEKSLV